MKSWIEKLIGSDRRSVLPILTSPGISLIGKAAGEVFRSGELQFEAIRALAQRFSSAAAMTMMDLSLEAEAFGAKIKYSENENPNIIGSLVQNMEEIEKLSIPEIGVERTGESLIAAKLCAENITDRPTLGGLIGPFSLAGRLLDMSRLMILIVTEPATVHALLEKATLFLLEYARAFKATGCAGLLMAEPAAGLISPKMAQDFSYDYIKRIVDAVQDENFAFVLHNCGRTEKMIPEMLSSGASAIHLGNTVNMRTILQIVPENVPVMGNLDPSSVFLMGTPEDVFSATTALLEATEEFPNFVLSSGCDIPPGTPICNIEAFFSAFEQFRTSVSVLRSA